MSSIASGLNERDQADNDVSDATGGNLFPNGFRLLQFDTCSEFLTVLHSDNPYDVKRAVLTLYYNLLENLTSRDVNGERTATDSLLLSNNICRLSSQIDENNNNNNNINNTFTAVDSDNGDLLSPEDSDPFIRSWKASSLRAHQGGGILSPPNSFTNPNGADRNTHLESVNSSPLAGILPVAGAEGGSGLPTSTTTQSKVPICAACIRQLFFIVATSTSGSDESCMQSPIDGATTATGVDSPNLNLNPHAKHRQPVGNSWLEVNKTIAFIFQLIVSRGFGKALADVLLHTGVRQGTTEEARQLNSIFHCECCESHAGSVPRTRGGSNSSPSGSEALDRAKERTEEPIRPSPLFAPPRGTIPPARIAALRLVLTFLIDAHGDAEHVLPAAEVFQALTHIRPLVKFMYAYMAIREDGDAQISSPDEGKSSEFYRTFMGQLCLFLNGPQLTSVGQAWKSLMCLLRGHRPYASVFLLYHMHSFVNVVLMTSIDDKNCVQKYYGLSLLSTILQEGAFGAASVLYATSPALLCSVLLCSNGLTSQAISQKIFEVLTKVICAPELSLPVRYILFTNRDSILRMVDYMSSLAYAQRAWDTQTFEQDRRRVLGRLSSLSPLSEEEMQFVLGE